MTYFISGSGSSQSPDVTIGSSGSTETSNLTPSASNVGRLTLDVTRPAESLGGAVGGFANTAQAIGKGIVNVAENIPVVGLVTKPVIGAIGAVADATVGNVVNAVAQSPVGQAIDFGATKAAEVALTPLDWALKAIMWPSHQIAKQTAEARIKSTLTGRQDPLSMLTGPAPDYAINAVKGGKTVEQVAEEMATSFGGDPKMGAFSQDAFANFIWTLATDPFTWFGGELLKPLEVGKLAMEANAIGVSRLRSLATVAEDASKAALKAGDEKLAKKLAEDAAKKIRMADAGENYQWWGEVYKSTFGRVKNPISAIIGSGTAKELGRRTLEAVDSNGGRTLLNKLEIAAGKDVVQGAVADSALTLMHAGASGVQELVVSAGRNIPESFASNMANIAHKAITEGADAAALLTTEIADKVTFGQLLKGYGMSDETVTLIAKKLVEGYDAVPKTFSSNPEVRGVINSITDYVSKANIKANPEMYKIQAEVLGRSNLRLFGDAAVETINRNKLILQRFADNPEQGIAYLSNMLQHAFELTPEKALEVATAQFAEHAGNTRELINTLELARGASFGKSIRMLANEKAGLPRTFSEVASTIARRKEIGKAFFSGLKPEEQNAAASVFDSIAYASATKRNITIEEFYDKYVYGISGLTNEEKAVSIVDNLYSIKNQAASSFELATTPEDYLAVANSLVPDNRILAMEKSIPGFSKSLTSELIPTTNGSSFALPGGESFLASSEPYSLLDQIKIAAQPWNDGISHEVRTKIYDKIWSSKNIDMQDEVSVINRIMHAVISPKLPLSTNAGVYSLLKVGSKDELAAFAERFGKIARDPKSDDAALGISVKEFISESDKLPVMSRNVGFAARQMVFAADNPSWFKLQPWEDMAGFAERLSMLKGSAMKVATFSPEMMRVADMPFGAIDSQMSVGIFWWAIKNGRLSEVESSLISIGKSGEEYLLANKETIAKLKNKFENGIEDISDVAGVEAKGIEINLAPTKIDSWPISNELKEMYSQVPEYLKKGKVTTFKNSSFEVMNNWVSEMSKSIPSLAKRSGAEQQWYWWDFTRKSLEPHFWVSNGVDAMEKPLAQDVLKALQAMEKSGGAEKVAFRGTDPNVITKLTENRGGQILGVTNISNDGRAMIELFKGSDITTALHEIGHFARRQLTDADQAIVQGFYKNNGVWDAASEERFAKEFVAYLSTGQAPIRELRDVFSKMREWIAKIWSDVSNGGQVEVNKDLTKVFDRLFIANPETTAAPAEHIWSRLTLVSARHMTQQVWDDAVQTADKVLGLTDGSSSLRELPDAIKESSRFLAEEGNIATTGGATYNPIRGTVRKPGDGFGLSVAWDRSLSAKGVDGLEGLGGSDRVRFLNDQKYRDGIMRDFIERNRALLEKDNFFVGLYDNGKRVYIDVSKVFTDLQDAIKHGLKNSEESIFSFAGENGDTIYLNTEKGIAEAALWGKKVVSSIADIEDIAKYEMAKDAPAIEKALRPLADKLIMKYDDVARHWYGKGAPAVDVIDYVRSHPEVITRELSAVEKANLPEKFARRIPELDLAGYRYALAPENGVLERQVMVQDSLGRDRITNLVSPFTDLMDQAAIKEFDKTVGRYAQRPTIMDRLVDKFTRQYGSEVVKNNYIERFTTKIVKDAKLSQSDALKIISRVGGLAAEQLTRPVGLWIEKAQVEEIFRQVMGNAAYKEYIGKGFKPFDEIVRAAAGDFGVVGLAPGASGRVKTFAPQMTVITDRAAPMARFGKINPVFWNWLEPIETKMGKLVHDIKLDFVDEMSAQDRSLLLQKMSMDNRYITREIADGLAYDQGQMATATLAAAEQVPGFLDHVAKVLRVDGVIKDAKVAVLDPAKYKLIAKNVTAAELGTRQVYDLLWQYSPGAMKDLAEFGLTDAQSLVGKIVEDGLVASNPEALARALAQGKDATISLWEDALRKTGGLAEKDISEIAGTAYGVFQDAMIRGTRIADKYQYFSQYRTWFERSINHPVLGVYPYSYMTQKAIPMMLNFLFKPRIAGRVRPLLGLTTYLRFKEYLAMESSSNDGFLRDLMGNRAVWYAVNMSLPATPERMGFGFSNFFTKGFLQPAAAGTPLDFQQLSKMPTLMGETLIRGTVLGQGGALLEAAGTLGSDFQGSIQGSLSENQVDILNFFGK
jgi:hypothetical protein